MKQTHGRSAADDGGGVAFRLVLRTATGEHGRKVRAAQAKAIKELLEWLDKQEQQAN